MSMVTNDITISDVIVLKFVATNKEIETVNILFIRSLSIQIDKSHKKQSTCYLKVSQ